MTRTEHDGTTTVLADRWKGKRLTKPDDAVVKSDGSTGFSDNGAGIRGNCLGDKTLREMPFRVYRIDDTTGAMIIALDDMERPNGFCFSPDDRLRRVVDTPSVRRTTRVYDVAEDSKALRNGRLLVDATPGYTDGIRCDMQGDVWCGFSCGEGQDGVAVFAPDGEMIGRILLPERCAKVRFGGARRSRLFMTASQSVCVLYVEAQGVLGG
ncbi:SMP-30/gluconolactonase/LRE family protein [Dankookia rubra]|uniref:SMP-30/gluconolactonase/LRE family protein n=1 Tax=Dankookia rubra TaxID=1442381 RepID=UPI001F4FA6D9|nr:SMP-30/gluconolactonase/LRE family protein [Dankookia rubra]